MITILAISALVLGILVGSFLNVVILRYNTGHSIAHGRSECLSCQSGLVWYELFPIVSFLVLKGRCRTCSVRLRMQYPLVEVITGAVFLGVLLKVLHVTNSIVVASSIVLLYWTLLSLLIVIFVYDLYHKIIPDGLVYTFIGLSFIQNFVSVAETGFVFAAPEVLTLFAGVIVALPFSLLWLVSRGMWMGFGDVKLALGIGWLLGVSLGFSAIILAFWIGAIVSLGLLALQKVMHRQSLTFKSEIPFAPFLIIGLLVVLMFPFNFLDVGGYLATYFI